jgi:hypothetical protein
MHIHLKKLSNCDIDMENIETDIFSVCECDRRPIFCYAPTFSISTDPGIGYSAVLMRHSVLFPLPVFVVENVENIENIRISACMNVNFVFYPTLFHIHGPRGHTAVLKQHSILFPLPVSMVENGENIENTFSSYYALVSGGRKKTTGFVVGNIFVGLLDFYYGVEI